MNSKSKNDVFYLILLILTMIIMVVGITFTRLAMLAKEDDDSTKVQTGSIAIDYIDGKNINSDGGILLPRYEPNINEDYAVYKKRFFIQSSGTLDQNLAIYINISKNEFKNNVLRFSLYNSEKGKIGMGMIPSSGKFLIGEDYLKSNMTNEYTLVIWLNENGTNQNDEMGKRLVGGFDIDASQIKYE